MEALKLEIRLKKHALQQNQISKNCREISGRQNDDLRALYQPFKQGMGHFDAEISSNGKATTEFGVSAGTS